MMFMPRALSAIPDASSALQRLTLVFQADLISKDTLVIDKDQDPALIVEDATFEWESFEKDSGEVFISKRGGRGGGGPMKGKGKNAEDKAKEAPTPGKDVPLFRVKNVVMTIPRGQLIAIVGPVGSGKVISPN
jgi:ATP-binding cassette, subfamily C (CFTR/MRP), member 1